MYVIAPIFIIHLVILLILSLPRICSISALIVPSKVFVSKAKVYTNASISHIGGLSESTWPISNSSTMSNYLSSCDWIDQEDISIVRYLDSGRFSNVFEGIWSEHNSLDSVKYLGQKQGKTVVLKVLKPTFIGKMAREIKVLEILKGTPGIIKLFGVSRHSGSQTLSLVFESLGADAQWLSHRAAPLTSFEIQLYMYKLLKALDLCHSKGIMHRDVKPRNVLYERKSGELRLIDWGLSDFYIPGKAYNPSVASRNYKCPELLFEYPYYDYSLDIWSAGCLFATLIFDMDPFFDGVDMMDQIRCISSVLGSDDILRWTKKCGIVISSEINTYIGSFRKLPFSSFRTSSNCNLCSDSAIDLLSQMLVVDHQQRLSAKECLNHPYFDNVRDLID